jgi:peptide/nickel transport system ATP-binding protein
MDQDERIRSLVVPTWPLEAVELLVADEPTPGLHEEAVRESVTRLRRLADTGKGVLLISHDIVSCLTVADRVAVFLDGEVV